MDYIFNELSLTRVHDIYKARVSLETFVKLCIGVKKTLKLETLRIPDSLGNLYNICIADDYPISKWCHDLEVDHDIRDKFRLIIANPPLLKSDEIIEHSEYERSCFSCNSKEAKGLGIAYLLDTLSVSLMTTDWWNSDKIAMKHDYFNEHEEIETKPIEVLHASKNDHLKTHIAHFEEKRVSFIKKCSEIWDKRETLFPNLVFCGDTERQLQRGIGSQFVFQIYERLLELNRYVGTWHDGEFSVSDLNSKTNLNCSTESDGTIRLYGDQRRFSVPEKGKIIFTLHIKTGNLRFYFYPDLQIRKAYIGYIGNHLDTITG